MAGILEPVSHLTIQSQNELSVFLVLLLVFFVRHWILPIPFRFEKPTDAAPVLAE